MNPAPHRRYARIAQQLAELLGAPAREAGLVPMISIFNLGEPDDYRVPDGGLFHPGPDAVYLPTAELVVEIVSPGDESWQKLGFYAARRRRVADCRPAGAPGALARAPVGRRVSAG